MKQNLYITPVVTVHPVQVQQMMATSTTVDTDLTQDDIHDEMSDHDDLVKTESIWDLYN